jgi:hypothetical protein
MGKEKEGEKSRRGNQKEARFLGITTMAYMHSTARHGAAQHGRGTVTTHATVLGVLRVRIRNGTFGKSSLKPDSLVSIYVSVF